MKKTKQHIVLFLFIGISLFASKISFSQSETFEETAFKAMQDEMNRSLSNLKIDKLKSPYYISYLITDAKLYSVEAQHGGVLKVIDKPLRNQETMVFVGGHKRNNMNFVNENKLFGWYGGSNGLSIPIENDYNAIRRSLWLTTDIKYKLAAEMFETKLSAIKP